MMLIMKILLKKHGIHLFYIIGGEGEEGEEKVNIYASMKAYNEACRRIGTLYQDRYVPALIRCTLLAVALTGMRLEGWSPDEVVEEQ